MKKIAMLALFVLVPVLCMGQEIAVKDDSTTVESVKANRSGLVILGATKIGGVYRMLSVDAIGAMRDASFDSVRTDTLNVVGTDTLVITDGFSYSPTIKATVDLMVRTDDMLTDNWIYVSANESVTLPFVITNGDTVFVSTAATIPEFQMIRGRMR